MRTVSKLLTQLIQRVETLDLPSQDLAHAREFLEYNEWGLCFDTVVTSLDVYKIQLDQALVKLIEEIAQKMEIPRDTYQYIYALLPPSSQE